MSYLSVAYFEVMLAALARHWLANFGIRFGYPVWVWKSNMKHGMKAGQIIRVIL